jgi:hypothetical protein
MGNCFHYSWGLSLFMRHCMGVNQVVSVMKVPNNIICLGILTD